MSASISSSSSSSNSSSGDHRPAIFQHSAVMELVDSHGREIEDSTHGQQQQQHGNASTGDASTTMDSMTMMRMYFHFGIDDQLLLKSFAVDGSYKLLLACLVLCSIAILNEAIRRWRTIKCNCEMGRPFRQTLLAKLSDHEHEHDDGFTSCDKSIRFCCSAAISNISDGDGGGGGGNNNCGKEQDNSCDGAVGSDANRRPSSPRIPRRRHCEYWLFKQERRRFKLCQAVLHMLSQSLGLTLMLAAMTFNVCLIFSIVLGECSLADPSGRARPYGKPRKPTNISRLRFRFRLRLRRCDRHIPFLQANTEPRFCQGKSGSLPLNFLNFEKRQQRELRGNSRSP